MRITLSPLHGGRIFFQKEALEIGRNEEETKETFRRDFYIELDNEQIELLVTRYFSTISAAQLLLHPNTLIRNIAQGRVKND